MIPKTLSASSAAVFEACPDRWKTEYLDKVAGSSSSAADLGTACHSALEEFVVNGYRPMGADKQMLETYFLKAYENLFEDDSRKAEGLTMMRTWHDRTDFTGRNVLSTEIKDHFDLPLPDGTTVPFNYIWDRCDELQTEHGELHIEIIDYKTISRPISPEGLKDKIQARCYGLAGQIKYPDAKKVWVTFDLLRWEPVGIVFTRDENIATWKYLKGLAKRIWECDDPKPRLNDECHWCAIRHKCDLLTAAVDAGSVLALDDPFEIAQRRHELTAQTKALGKVIEELDQYLLTWSEKEELLEWETDALRVVVTASKRRSLERAEAAAKILGPDLFARYGNLTITSLDKLLKEGKLTSDQANALRGLVVQKVGEASIKTIPKNPIDSSI